MPKRKGAPYRRVVTTLWSDPRVKRLLSLEEKAFLLYLTTNEHSHPCGLYRLPPLLVFDELGIDAERMLSLLGGPLEPFATYDRITEEVFVPSMGENQFDGTGLRGGDKRIRWVTSHLQTIHSNELIKAFRERYPGWELPWAEILPDVPEPKLKVLEDTAVEGAHKGLPKPDPAPDPDPVTGPQLLGIQPPAQSSGYSLAERCQQGGQEVRTRSSRGPERIEHPALRHLWRELQPIILEVWHHGQESVTLTQASYGMAAERLALNDLLHDEPDEDFVRFLVAEAPAEFGWRDEPRSLQWAKRPENREAARSVYHRRERPLVTGVELRRMDDPRRPEPDLQAAAQRKVAELQRRGGFG